MNKRYALILGSLFFVSVTLFAQDTKKAPATTKPATTKPATTKSPAPKQAAKPAAAAPSEADMQKAMMDYMTPGKMHQMLSSCNGQWHEDVTFWMAPGAAPSTGESNCDNHMILGERYQESIHQGQMMGMPFEGRGIVGYDNARNMFQSTWIDNMGTGTMFLEGKYDEASKSITFKGNMVDPSTGKSGPVREVVKFIDDHTQMMEMYVTKDGKEFKTMEIKMTKQG